MPRSKHSVILSSRSRRCKAVTPSLSRQRLIKRLSSRACRETSNSFCLPPPSQTRLPLIPKFPFLSKQSVILSFRSRRRQAVVPSSSNPNGVAIIQPRVGPAPAGPTLGKLKKSSTLKGLNSSPPHKSPQSPQSHQPPFAFLPNPLNHINPIQNFPCLPSSPSCPSCLNFPCLPAFPQSCKSR